MNPNDVVKAPRANSLDVDGEPKDRLPTFSTDERRYYPGSKHYSRG